MLKVAMSMNMKRRKKLSHTTVAAGELRKIGRKGCGGSRHSLWQIPAKPTHQNGPYNYLRRSNAAYSKPVPLIVVVRRVDPRGIEVEVVAVGGGVRGSRPIVALGGLVAQAVARVEVARVNPSPRILPDF
jgi:hypothetical protein